MKYEKKRSYLFYASLVMLLLIGMGTIGALYFGKNQSSNIYGLRFQNSGEGFDEYIRAQMQTCLPKGDNHCYQRLADLLSEQFSLQEVLAALERNEAHWEVFARCHTVTHYLARNAYREVKNLPEVYGECTAVCWGGCYHGVIEEYLDETNLPISSLPQEIPRVCGNEKDYTTPRLYDECVHGIGHAAMFVTGADLPQALQLCDSYEFLRERETCYGGVFMENSSSSTNLDHPSVYLKKEDPMYPCTILEERYLKLCYQYQSSYFAEIAGWDWKAVIALCQQVPKEYRDGCFSVIGSNQVGYTTEISTMKENCELILDDGLRQNCIAGVVSGLGGRYIGDPSRMIAFCSLVNTKDKKTCYIQLSFAIRSWTRDLKERELLCKQIKEEPYTSRCQQEFSTE